MLKDKYRICFRIGLALLAFGALLYAILAVSILLEGRLLPRVVKAMVQRNGVYIFYLSAAFLIGGAGLYFSEQNRRKRFLQNALVAFLSLLFSALLAYAVYIGFRSLKLYHFIRLSHRGVTGKISAYDPELGFAPLPNSRGFMKFPIGPDYPIWHDRRGFRIPATEDSIAPLKKPLVMSFGCSFSYGDGCLAEEAYSYLVGEALGGSSINASVLSYGLTQMLIKAERLIPEYQPDYVIFQYSDWLVVRAVMNFVHTYTKNVQTPFYRKSASGELFIEPPLFKTKVFDLPVSQYVQKSPGNLSDFLSFLWHVGVPLCLHDDPWLVWNKIKDLYLRTFRGYPLIPNLDLGFEVIGPIYNRFHQLCQENGAKMIILKLRFRTRYIEYNPTFNLPGVIVLDADSVLTGLLPDESDETFLRAYAHWRGTPPVLVDGHPNAEVHRIMAEEIVKAIRTDTCRVVFD